MAIEDDLAAMRDMQLTLTGDPVEEGRANLCWLALADDERPVWGTAKVAAGLAGVLAAWSAQLRHAGASGLFYVWHDEQTGQLRVSAIGGASRARLPFGAPLLPIDEVTAIIERWLTSRNQGRIPWDELEVGEVAEGEPLHEEPPLPPVHVFVAPLGLTPAAS